MKIKSITSFFFCVITAIVMSACSTQKVANIVNDDVYFNDLKAKQLDIVYAQQEITTPAERNQIENRYDDQYFENEYRSGFDNFSFRNNFTWRDYYYRNNLIYDPFFSYNNFYGFNNGWSLSFNNGFPFWNSTQYSYFNINPWNVYGYYGQPLYGGIYSYYQPGYYGYYGNYNGYYNNNGIYNAVPKTPRPSGSYDNARRPTNAGGTNITYPNRPIRNDAINVGGNNTVQNTGSQTRTGTVSRPTRTSNNSGTTTSAPTQTRPSRSDSPTTTSPTQSSDSGRSSSGSSNSGSTSSPRPTRTGGGN
jgi:hypothetical protein